MLLPYIIENTQVYHPGCTPLCESRLIPLPVCIDGDEAEKEMVKGLFRNEKIFEYSRVRESINDNIIGKKYMDTFNKVDNRWDYIDIFEDIICKEVEFSQLGLYVDSDCGRTWAYDIVTVDVPDRH